MVCNFDFFSSILGSFYLLLFFVIFTFSRFYRVFFCSVLFSVYTVIWAELPEINLMMMMMMMMMTMYIYILPRVSMQSMQSAILF